MKVFIRIVIILAAVTAAAAAAVACTRIFETKMTKYYKVY